LVDADADIEAIPTDLARFPVGGTDTATVNKWLKRRSMQTQSNNNREGVRRVTQHGKGIVYKPVRKRTSNISGSIVNNTVI